MVTLLFILIAYAIRKRYLPEAASRMDKIIYYSFCVVMTPLFGPWLFKFFKESRSAGSDSPEDVIWPYAG